MGRSVIGASDELAQSSESSRAVDAAAVVARGRTSAVGCVLLLLCGFPPRVFTDLLLAELGILDVKDDRVCVTVTETHVRLEPREQLAVCREALPLRHREVLLRALARLGLDVVDVRLVRHTVRSMRMSLPGRLQAVYRPDCSSGQMIRA